MGPKLDDTLMIPFQHVFVCPCCRIVFQHFVAWNLRLSFLRTMLDDSRQ